MLTETMIEKRTDTLILPEGFSTRSAEIADAEAVHALLNLSLIHI